ncbi:hypothetical protein FRB94_014675 [Tulasnella sp. JGI-2019a]|nr:hypothetical protein FRB94_014675 [Tulasnella sp. JGI-2019a]
MLTQFIKYYRRFPGDRPARKWYVGVVFFASSCYVSESKRCYVVARPDECTQDDGVLRYIYLVHRSRHRSRFGLGSTCTLKCTKQGDFSLGDDEGNGGDCVPWHVFEEPSKTMRMAWLQAPWKLEPTSPLERTGRRRYSQGGMRSSL